MPATNAMQIINLPLAIGGAVAALVVVSKYPSRRDDTPTEAMGRKVGAFFVTGLPGIIIAQVSYDIAANQFPYLSKIPSLSLGVGLVLGGCGLPLFLALRERLPSALADGVISWAQGKLKQKGSSDSEEPTDKQP